MVPEWVKLYINFKLLKDFLSVSGYLKKMLIIAKKTRSLNEYRSIKRNVQMNKELMEKLNNDND